MICLFILRIFRAVHGTHCGKLITQVSLAMKLLTAAKAKAKAKAGPYDGTEAEGKNSNRNKLRQVEKDQSSPIKSSSMLQSYILFGSKLY